MTEQMHTQADPYVCPDCGRDKALTVTDAANGLCPKWWAVRDQDAAIDCERHAARTRSALVAPDASPPEAVDALVLMVDAFLSRHGCFPHDKTTNQERLWNRAMLAAYDVIGQPRTRERETKLADLSQQVQS